MYLCCHCRLRWCTPRSSNSQGDFSAVTEQSLRNQNVCDHKIKELHDFVISEVNRFTKRSEICLWRHFPSILILHQSQATSKYKTTTSTFKMQLKSLQFSCYLCVNYCYIYLTFYLIMNEEKQHLRYIWKRFLSVKDSLELTYFDIAVLCGWRNIYIWILCWFHSSESLDNYRHCRDSDRKNLHQTLKNNVLSMILMIFKIITRLTSMCKRASNFNIQLHFTLVLTDGSLLIFKGVAIEDCFTMSTLYCITQFLWLLLLLVSTGLVFRIAFPRFSLSLTPRISVSAISFCVSFIIIWIVCRISIRADSRSASVAWTTNDLIT